MAIITGDQFRNENTDSRYPFADNATLISQSGMQLGDDIVVDALLHPVSDTNQLYLDSIQITGATALFVIGDNTASKYVGTADLSTIQDGSIGIQDGSQRPAGILVVDPLRVKTLLGWAQGVHTFGITAAPFVLSCCVPSPLVGVTGLAAADMPTLTGDVWLVGENGVILSFTDQDSIRVDVVGEPLAARKLCHNNEAFVAPQFLKTINNIPPSAWGGFTLTIGKILASKPALRITPDQGSILIELASADVTEAK